MWNRFRVRASSSSSITNWPGSGAPLRHRAANGASAPNEQRAPPDWVTPALHERLKNLSGSFVLAHHQKVAVMLNTFTSGRSVGALRRFTSWFSEVMPKPSGGTGADGGWTHSAEPLLRKRLTSAG